MPSTLAQLTSKQTVPRPWLRVIEALPEASGSPGPGTSAAPVSVADRGRPPYAPRAPAGTARTSAAEGAPARLTRRWIELGGPTTS